MKKHIRLLLVALSILAIYGSVIYFDKVIPLLDIEISTDKQGMLEKAKEISKKYNIGPQEFRQVIYFNSEPNIQNYIELELNEQENSNQNFIKDKSLYQYYQYTWQVRHFDQYDKNESVIKFTPDGKFYGFIEYIPENKYLPSLDESQAKELVEQFLKTENKIDLNDYIEVSKSSETRINGRVDHNFVYQKNVTDDNLDNLKYRITLGVCGNKITVFNPYIDVPEVFNKKFAQLGVLGETISYFANMFTYIFYIFFGFLFGFVYLSRINWLMTRKSIVLGIILAIAELIYKLNEISIIWINYNTSNSFYSHLVNHLVGDFVLFLVSVFIYSSTIAVAEGLTRLAFADHLQFFKLLNFKVLSSKEFLKKSLISYLILPLEVLFALLFYTFGFKLFGWWISSTSLINPNILSTYFPGISVLAQAFKSAIWEECLFRAIPLSFFYLICKKLKYKNIILCLGLIIQALMFSASHANYLAIPEYLRVIELIVPSIVFGLIYLRWGLFPVILIHYTYDIIFLSLPILTSNNIIIEKLIIVTGFFLPILVSLMTYVIRLYNLKGSKQEDLSSEFYNKNWNPKLIELDNNQKQREPDLKSFDYKHIYIVSLGYVCFFLMSLCFTSLKPDIPNIVITKDQAIDIAKNFLKNKDVDLDPSWSILTSIYNPADIILENKFLWDQSIDLYKTFVNLNYIYTPMFMIRFVKFEGSQLEREREYDVYVSANGQVLRYKHIVPYDVPGKYLFKDQAQELAINFIETEFGLDKNNIEEVSSKIIERKDRQDWEFVFKDNTDNIKFGNDINKQINIYISGSKVTDIYRNIFVPQDMLKTEEYNKQLYHGVVLAKNIIFLFFVVIALIKFLTISKVNSSRLGISNLFLFIYSAFTIIKRFLVMPEVVSNFSTSKPFLIQIISSEFIAAIANISHIILVVLMFVISINYDYRKQIVNRRNLKYSLILSGALGLFISANIIFFKYFIYSQRPIALDFYYLNSYWPSALYIIDNILTYIDNIFYFIFVAHLAKYKFNLQSIILFMLASVIIVPLDNFYIIDSWFIFCFSIFILLFTIYIFIVRFDIVLIPLIYNVIYQVYLIRNYLMQDSTAFLIPTILSMFSILICCLIIVRYLKYKNCINLDVKLDFKFNNQIE